MGNSKYHLQLVLTVACTRILIEVTNEIGQRYIKGMPVVFYFW